METAIANTKQFNSIANMLHFIAKYRQMEKAPLTTGYQMIGEISTPHLADHLRGHWRGKQKNFGSLYLNLSYEYRLALSQRFGILDSDDAEFVKKSNENPVSMIFKHPTGFLATANKILLFFNNHGIDPNPMGDGSLMLTNLPAAKKRYGNSANWGDYIMSLLMQDRIRVLTAILNRPD